MEILKAKRILVKFDLFQMRCSVSWRSSALHRRHHNREFSLQSRWSDDTAGYEHRTWIHTDANFTGACIGAKRWVCQIAGKKWDHWSDYSNDHAVMLLVVVRIMLCVAFVQISNFTLHLRECWCHGSCCCKQNEICITNTLRFSFGGGFFLCLFFDKRFSNVIFHYAKCCEM